MFMVTGEFDKTKFVFSSLNASCFIVFVSQIQIKTLLTDLTGKKKKKKTEMRN